MSDREVEMQKVERPWLSRFFREWVRPILIVVIVACTFRSAIADWNDVPTPSMNPTILEGDRIFVNKLAYDLKVPFTRVRLMEWDEPGRGDVVVFFSPDQGIRMVKRIIGVPGDRLTLRDNRLFINGRAAGYGPLDEEIIDQMTPEGRAGSHFAAETIDGDSHPVMVIPGRGSRTSFATITVPEGHFFAMGDNRDNSRDSRWFGFVPGEQIVGRATGIAMSFDPMHWYLPRWERFFTPMQ